MKNIDTILEEWEDFASVYNLSAKTKLMLGGFIRISFAEYKKGLREAIEGKKSKVAHTHMGGCFECAQNMHLDSVLELLK